MDSKEVDFCFVGLIRGAVLELFGCEVVLSILIVDLKVSGGSHLSHESFRGAECLQFLLPMRAVIVTAFVAGGNVSPFPFIERTVAMRTIVFGFPFSQPFMDLECTVADFTFELSPSFPIIEIDIVVRCVAVRTREL